MATNATGTQPRNPPPSPSSRNSSSRSNSARPARRASNHPPPLSGLAGPFTNSPQVTGAQHTANASTVVTSAATSAKSPSHTASASTGAVRDELVRAVMPELRLLLQHLVDSAVERSLSPVVEKQRELEAALRELRSAQLQTEHPRDAAAKQTAQFAAPHRSAPSEPYPVANQNSSALHRELIAPATNAPIERSPVATRTETRIAPTYDTSSFDDIPSELNGSRRKKLMLWLFAGGAVVVLMSVIGLSVLSNVGVVIF